MSTYSASRRVNGPGHPFDGRLEGYYRGLVPQLPQVTGYSPTNLDTTQFSPMINGWGTKYPVSDMAPPLLAEGEGPPI
jgi:hypothetical protein